MKARVAVVDDAARMGEVLAMVLRAAGHEATPFERPEAFLDELSANPAAYDVVLTDPKMPRIDGIELLRRVSELAPDVPVLLITAHGTIGTAIEAMKQGAFDYLQKPIDNDVCRAAVERALHHSKLARENRYLRGQQGRKLTGWSSDVERWMLQHDWPGNVRELQNTIERGVVLAREEVMQRDDLLIGFATGEARLAETTLQGYLDQQAARHIEAVLQSAGGVKQDAARALGIERTTLYRLMKKYGIQ